MSKARGLLGAEVLMSLGVVVLMATVGLELHTKVERETIEIAPYVNNCSESMVSPGI